MLEDELRELDELLSSGELAGAERFLKDRLASLEEHGEGQSAAYLSLLNELASLYRGTSRFKESEQAFLRLGNVLEETGSTRTLPYATVALNVAGCYRLMGDTEQALAYYAEARSILRDLDKQATLTDSERSRHKYLTASVLNNISLLYIDLGRLDEALTYAEEAAKLIKEGVGDEHELATTYNNLANIYLKLQRFDDAERVNREALAIYDRMPKENVHHAAALSTFAVLCFRRADWDGAEMVLKYALELTEHFFGRNVEYESLQRSLARVRRAREGADSL
jgi:tetratricopeptide (TPR) repeat protein